MAKYTYPAVFEKEAEGGYSIFFPDVPGCYTQAESIAEGMENAADALCLMLYELEKQGNLPPATHLRDVDTGSDPESLATLIACDTRFYQNYYEAKSVKVNVTIPLWLKEEGEKKGVNYSQILQRGLREYLQAA